MPTLYTNPEGKAFIRNGALVTGDCCCGCESPSKCGLPHTTVELNIWFASGTWASRDGFVQIGLSFKVSGEMMPKGTVIIEGTPTDTGTEWAFVEGFGPFSWTTDCLTEKCSSSSRTSHVRLQSADPELDVYSLGEASVDVVFSSGAFTGEARIQINAIATRTFRTKILDPDSNIKRAGLPNDGDRFSMTFSSTDPGNTKNFTIMNV